MNQIKEIEKIEREQVAFRVEYNGFDAHGNRIEFHKLDVRFKDIRNSAVGDEFCPKTENLQNYNLSSAEVIFKTDEDAVIRVCFEGAFDDEYGESFEMIHVVFG